MCRFTGKIYIKAAIRPLSARGCAAAPRQPPGLNEWRNHSNRAPIYPAKRRGTSGSASLGGRTPRRPTGRRQRFFCAEGSVGGDADFVFYNNPYSACGFPDAEPGCRTGTGISHRLGDLPADVAKIAICLTARSGLGLPRARPIDLRIFNAARTD